jgi:NAD(P)-dependent dehydrogenase (short-subunit alcohol dehydrogenase family)
MDMKLSGRKALVTGANAGIGTGVAEVLARERRSSRG